MKSFCQRCLFWGLASLAVGLGGQAAAEPQAAPSAAPSRVAAGEPKVLASLSARNLDATLGLVREYLPIPIKPEAALSEVFGEFGSQVALSAPVYAVVALDSASATSQGDDTPAMPLWAFSVGVRSLSEAQRLAQSRGFVTVDPAKPAGSLLRIPVGGRSLLCLLSGGPASGAGRLSCSKQERDRDVLGPYLTRMPAPTHASDVHGELAVDALVAAYQGPWQRALQVVSLLAPQKLALGQPAFDRALTDATQVLIGQLQALSADLSSLSLDLSLSKGGIEARLAYRMVGQRSWWAQADAEQGATPAPAGTPPVFWTLPADSTSASFQITDPKWAKKLLELAVPLLDGYLTYDAMPAADRKAVSDVLTQALNVPRPGPVTTTMSTGKTGQPPAPAASGFDPSALFSGTYYLVATEGGNEWTLPWLKSLVATYNRPGVQAYLRAKWKKLDPTGALPVLKAEPLPKTLPESGYGIVLSGNFAALSREGIKPGGQSKVRQLTLHVVTVPVEGRLWTAMGTDRPTLLQRLAEQLKPQESKTLAQRGGLEALREAGLRGGGFTSLLAMSSYLDAALGAASRTSAVRSGQSERTARSAQLFNVAPHHGEVPMVYFSRRGKADAASRTSEFILRVPRLVIEDVAAIGLQMALDK